MQSDIPVCIHNRNIQCLDPSQCRRCGWDPDVFEERLARILHGIKANREKQTVMLLHAKIPPELALAELRAVWQNVRIS